VQVSALGVVWDKEEEDAAEEMRTGKLESAEEKHGPEAVRRDQSMEPLPVQKEDKSARPMRAELRAEPVQAFTPARKGDVMFVQATPNIFGEFRVQPAKFTSPSELRSEIGDWEFEGGRVRHEEENKGSLSDSTAKAKMAAGKIAQEDLKRVQAAADKVMSENADRRTSISALGEKKDEFPERELKVEFAPAPTKHHGGFAIEPPSETVAAGTKLEMEASPKETTSLLGKGAKHEDFIGIAPAAEHSHEGYEYIEDKEVRMPRGAEEKSESDSEKQGAGNAADSMTKVDVDKLMKLVVEPLSKIDESKLPPLTAEIAFAAPAALHEPTHHVKEPKHTPHDRVPGRAEHHVNQPRNQS